MLEQTNAVMEDLNHQLDQSEQLKLNQFAQLEKKEQKVLNL